MTTSVDLTTVWLTYAADPTDTIRLVKLATLDEQTSINARYDLTASGRIRQVRTIGGSTLWKLGLPFNPTNQIDWLTLHLGDTICARDNRGNKIFGTYITLPQSMHFHDTSSSSSIDFTGITYTEAV